MQAATAMAAGNTAGAAAAPLPLAEAANLRFMDPGKVRFFRSGAALRMTVEGEFSCLKVAVVRVFPMSDPDRYFSLRDAGGRELGILAGSGKLDPRSRALVEEDLERRYMIAVIRRIVSTRERFGTVEWDVDTSRGRCRFTTRDLRENIVRPSPGRYVIRDVDDNRYEVPDIRSLDLRSQGRLLQHL